jgi:hypothetical protein
MYKIGPIFLLNDLHPPSQYFRRSIMSDEKSAASNSAPAAGAATGGDMFEIKKWNAVAMWSWDLRVDSCAICRNHIMVTPLKSVDFV